MTSFDADPGLATLEPPQPSRTGPSGHAPLLFSLDTGQALAERVCEQLGVTLGRHEEREFEDGESKLRPLDNVRGRDVYVIESLHGDTRLSIADKLVRLLFFLATLRDAGAARLTCVAPYLSHARKDQRTKVHDPVTTRYLAGLFESVGVDRMITIDVHNPAAYQNAFRIRAELLTGVPLLADAIAPMIGPQSVAVLSPDTGGIKRAERFRHALERRLGRPVALAFVNKFRSEGVIRGSTVVVGDVDDRVVVIVDDLISSGSTLVRAAVACQEQNARMSYAAVSHGVFAVDASRVLRDSPLERVFVLDTIAPQLDADLLAHRVQVLDCAPLLGRAIAALHGDESLDELTAEQ